MQYTVYEVASGKVMWSGCCVDEDYEHQFVPDGCGILPIGVDHVKAFIVDGVPEQIPERPSKNHVWNWDTHTWDMKSVSEIESEADFIARAKRSQMLAECDWTQLPDVPSTTKALWADYRQQLRDITSQSGYPMNISWPEKPV